MKFGIVLSSNDPETVFNAIRLANYARNEGDDVSIFLLGKGVELDTMGNGPFEIHKGAKSFLDAGGKILACGTCLELRDSEGSEICPVSTMGELYDLIDTSDRLVTF